MKTMTATHDKLHSTLEQGLGVRITKIGPGEKEEAYAMNKSRVRWILMCVLAALTVLAILVGVYAALFNDERIRRIFQEKKALEKIGESKVDAVRLGMAIHQQEAEREHQEDDTKRSYKRIMSVIGRKFDELLADAKDEDFLNRLRESKSALTDFVNEELQDFEKEKKAYDAEAKKRLEKLANVQEESLRELLKSVSGVKMEAIEEMLEEVFAAGKRAPELEVSDSVVDEIEALADAMYEEKVDLEKGRERLATLKLQISGTLPDELNKEFTDAKDADEFAEALDDLVETVKLARGKKEIAVIEESWRKAVEKARESSESDNNNNDDDDEDGYDEEIKENVDALIKIQKLVAEGKVPVYLLDWEAIDMSDDDDDDDDDDEDDNNDGQNQQDDGQQQQQDDQSK